MQPKEKAKSVESPGAILVEAGIFIAILLSVLALLSLIQLECHIPALKKTPVREHWLPVLLFLVGMTVTLSAFFTIKGELDCLHQTEFSWEAHNRNNALKKGIEDGLESVRVVRDLYRSSEHVTRSGFNYFTQVLLARYRGIQALGQQ